MGLVSSQPTSPPSERETEQSSLCDRCQALHLPGLFGGRRMGETSTILNDIHEEIEKYSVTVGTFSSLSDDPLCSLCHLLRIIHGRHHVECDGEDEVCYLLPMRADFTLPLHSRDTMKDVPFQYLNTETDRLATDVYILFRTKPSDTRHVDTYNEWFYRGISLHWRFKLESSSAVPSRPFLNHSKVANSGIAFSAIREWMDECESHHDECGWGLLSEKQVHMGNRNAGRKVSDAHPIRCIDVLSGELVSIDPSDRYVCLSYVWGDIDLAAQRKSFVPEGYQVNVKALPQTIQDAIITVREMREMYLWSDLVCINQQDPEDFNAQIQQMDLIFEGAICTLVALNGRSANSGLPGVQPGSRQEVAYPITIEGACVIAGPHIPFNNIKRGYWRKRGWTFQEELLSRRCVFFGGDEVLLSCRGSVGRETIDSPSLGRRYLFDTEYESGKAFGMIWRFQAFQERVAEYLARTLSYDTDILRAFTGALQWMSQDTQMPFVHGTPKDDLLNGLLWVPRRESVLLCRRNMFPSWSWLEWRGDLTFPYWATSWAEQEDGRFEAEDVGVAAHVYTRKSKIKATTVARASVCGTDDEKVLLQTEVREFGIVRRVPDPPGYGDPDTSDHFLTRQDGSAIQPTKTYELPFHSDDIIPLILGDRPEVLEAPAQLAFLAHFTGREQASDFDGKWDRVVAMLIQRHNDGTAERLAVVNLAGTDWAGAPVMAKQANIVLV